MSHKIIVVDAAGLLVLTALLTRLSHFFFSIFSKNDFLCSMICDAEIS